MSAAREGCCRGSFMESEAQAIDGGEVDLTDRKYKATFSPPPLPPASAGGRCALATLAAPPACSGGRPQRLAARHSAA